MSLSLSLRTLALSAVATGWLLLLHMLLLGSSAPVERHLGLHAGIGPMRVVLLSDLHVATPGDTPARLRGTVMRVNALHPDLVLLAGDFLSTETPAFAAPPDEVVPIVAGLRARLGVVAVLGNHDYGRGRSALEAGLQRVGITLLRNQAVRRGPLAILGIGDTYTGHADPRRALLAARRLGGLPVVLSHEPDVAAKLDPSLRLVLSGHTHCGQVSPWPIGPIVTASAYGKRYACGLIREGARLTLVSAGLGTSSLPIRLGAVPDFWVIDFAR
jgi:predicted MPP superfamily phosphohydrolase